MGKRRIIVIIVTYNAMMWVDRCFGSLQCSGVVPDVFVIDNGSTDGTQAYIKEHYPLVMFWQSEENLGFGKANNIGLQYALDNQYDYVYLLNQDAWVMSDTFETMIAISENHPEYGILSPLQYKGDERNLDDYFSRLLTNYGRNYGFINDILAHELKPIYDVKSVMAAHWLITNACLLKVGGFSPTFPHYGEDDNYCDRIRFHGYKIGVIPAAKAVHLGGTRVTDIKKRLHLINMGNRAIFSNPTLSFHKMISRFVYATVRNVMKYPSVGHFKNMISLLVNMRVICRNRAISMKGTAPFLKP